MNNKETGLFGGCQQKSLSCTVKSLRDSWLVCKMTLTFNSETAADWSADVCRECKQFTVQKQHSCLELGVIKCFEESKSNSDDLNSSNLRDNLENSKVTQWLYVDWEATISLLPTVLHSRL